MKDAPAYPDPPTGEGEARREPGGIRRSEGVDTIFVQVATEMAHLVNRKFVVMING